MMKGPQYFRESPDMTDPLAEVVTLLQPRPAFSKRVSANGIWRVLRSDVGRPFYGAVLSGSCRLVANGRPPLVLHEGDFVLIPEAYAFETTSLEPPPAGIEMTPLQGADGEFRIGDPEAPAEVRLLIGYCVFDSPDAALLISLLPQIVHVGGEDRLGTLVRLVVEEARGQRPAREVILERLLQVLLIEALRAAEGAAPPRGLVRGLADRRIGAALRRMHEAPTRPWTVAQLAREAGMSRSAFFDRFNRAVGLAPMEYLLAWRMALAKTRLRRGDGSVAEIAQAAGYGSASAFSVAFARHVGVPPARYARAEPVSA